MGISVTKQAAVPAGAHKGVIINAEQVKKTFDNNKGPEDVIEVTIQPKWKLDDATETLAVTVSFSPVLNGLSALSKLLKRIGREPKGDDWDPSEIIGVEVSFTCKRTEKDFVQVMKDTIKSA